LIESPQKFHKYYGRDFKVECPTGSGNYLNIGEVAHGPYRLQLATTRNEVEAALRLRFEVFNIELHEGLAESFFMGMDVASPAP
jgi:hypothetical protein